MQRYRHIKKRGEYKVLYYSKMKIGQVWIDCIVYQSLKDGKVWVREHLDFEENFEKFIDLEGKMDNIFSVCVLITGEDGTILAVSRKDDHNDFGLPGGKIDPGETAEEAIIREVKEETGLDLVNVRFQFVQDCIDKKHGVMPCAVYIANVTGEINYNEPHVVKYVEPKVVLNGTFRDFNVKTFELLNFPY